MRRAHCENHSRAVAQSAGLRYTGDDLPGIRRMRRGSGFRFVAPDGEPIRDGEILQRILALAVPPAWRSVWISPHADSHIQASGRDARGRKQYRYHARWRTARDDIKYRRVLAFGEALPRIRRSVERDLCRRGLSRDRVLATLVRILERTGIRIGNEAYARENRHFGLTTLRCRHVRLSGDRLRFQFIGKSGVRRVVELADAQVARVVASCRRLSGVVLFQYLDNRGARQAIRSEQVNQYLHAIGGDRFTAKDFRTWVATLLMCRALSRRELVGSERNIKRQLTGAIDEVALVLGNTRSTCRASYIHPAVMRVWTAGAFAQQERAPRSRGFSSEEALLLRLLRAGSGQSLA